MAPGSSDLLIKSADEYFDALIKSRFIEMFDGDYDYRPLGDLFKTSSGGTPLKSKQEYYREGDTPWLTSGEINKLHITSANTRITRLALEETSAKIPPIGSVLVSMYGSIGYAGILEFESAINQAICAIHPNEHFVPIWLCYYIRSKKDDLTNQGAGAALTNISQEKIRKLKVMCPPAELQNQFADFVKQVDKSKLVFREMVSKLDELIKARFIEMFSACNTTPLTHLANITMGQSPESSSYNNLGRGIPFFQGKTEFEDTFVRINQYCDSPKKRAAPMDILMSVRAPVGSVNITPVECCIGRGLAAISPKDNVNVWFLFYALKIIEKEVADLGVGSTFKAINKANMDEIMLPDPPPYLQNQFADFVKQVDKLKSEILEGVKKLRIPQ